MSNVSVVGQLPKTKSNPSKREKFHGEHLRWKRFKPPTMQKNPSRAARVALHSDTAKNSIIPWKTPSYLRPLRVAIKVVGNFLISLFCWKTSSSQWAQMRFDLRYVAKMKKHQKWKENFGTSLDNQLSVFIVTSSNKGTSVKRFLKS